MVPKKVTMEYIADDSTRKSICQKRATGVIKMASELSTLCGVEVCVAMIFPEAEAEMQVWPSLPEATPIVGRFRSMPEPDQRRKKMDAEGYVRERIGKARDQLRKAEHENQHREATLRLHEAMAGNRASLDGLPVEQLVGMGWTTQTLIKKIRDCIGEQQQAGVKTDPLPTIAAADDVDAPGVQQGWGLDMDAMASSGSRCGSGTYGTAGGAGDDAMQVGDMDTEFAWADHPGST